MYKCISSLTAIYNKKVVPNIQNTKHRKENESPVTSISFRPLLPSFSLGARATPRATPACTRNISCNTAVFAFTFNFPIAEHRWTGHYCPLPKANLYIQLMLYSIPNIKERVFDTIPKRQLFAVVVMSLVVLVVVIISILLSDRSLLTIFVLHETITLFSNAFLYYSTYLLYCI